MASVFKPWKIKNSDYIFVKEGMLHLKDFYVFIIPNKKIITCFKYGELKMKVSLPGISSKRTKMFHIK